MCRHRARARGGRRSPVHGAALSRRRPLLSVVGRGDGPALSRGEPSADARARRPEGQRRDDERRAARRDRRAGRSSPRRARRGRARRRAIRTEQLVRVERAGDARRGARARAPSARVPPLLHPRRRGRDRHR